MEINSNGITESSLPLTEQLTEQQLRESLAFVAKAKNPKGTTVFSDLSRVTEQDMFAAVIHGQLKVKGTGLLNDFENKFVGLLPDLLKDNPTQGVFEAARRSFKSLRRAGTITKEAARIMRQETLGRSQFDSKRDELSIKNVTGKVGDTALRAVKTALSKFKKSVGATNEEFTAFKFLNATRRAESRAAKNDLKNAAPHS